MPLPYSQVPNIMYENMKRVSKCSLERIKVRLPFDMSCRPLPKGTICNVFCKTLHDDDNSCISPAIWTNLVEDVDTVLSFKGVNFNISIQCTTNRFCWFMGYVPHYTKNKDKKMFECSDGTKVPLCVSHSAYSKSVHEFLFLNAFNKENCETMVDNIYQI